MLSIKIEKDRRLTADDGNKDNTDSQAGPPGGIKDALTLVVSVSSTWYLAIRHLSWRRAGQLILGALVAFALAIVSLYIRTSTQLEAESSSACNDLLSVCVASGNAYLGNAYDSWQKTALHVLGAISLLLVLYASIRARNVLLKVHVVFLAPYEQFPVVPSKVQISKNDHIYAVRLLSDGARNRFHNRLFSSEEIHPDFKGFTSISLISDEPKELLRRRLFPIKDYSCLVRHAFIQLLPHTSSVHGRSTANETIKALYFTYKQHRTTLRIYIFLLVAAILAPISFGFGSNEHFQFPLLMAALGVTWAIATAFIHRAKGRHLDEWEFKTLGDPFNGCPVFRYSKTESIEEHWSLVPPEEFHARITSFGVDHNTLQQWVLAGLLIVYLTVLQLIK